MTRDEVTRIVEDELRGLLGRRMVPIKGTDHLTFDLRIDSDDLSFLFCPNVQRRCGVHLSVDEWAQIGTVDEVVNAMLSPAAPVRVAHDHSDVTRPRRPVIGVFTAAAIVAILVLMVVGGDVTRTAAMAGLVVLTAGRWGLVAWRGLRRR